MKKKYKEPKLDVIEIRLEDTVLTGSPTEFGGEPNTHCCPICMAMPGTLPVLNEKVHHFGCCSLFRLRSIRTYHR